MLKILTMGAVFASTPTDVVRTAAGQVSMYLLVPVGIGMAWIAKQIADSGLHESKGCGSAALRTLHALLIDFLCTESGFYCMCIDAPLLL